MKVAMLWIGGILLALIVLGTLLPESPEAIAAREATAAAREAAQAAEQARQDSVRIERENTGNGTMAAIMCEEFVTDRLLAPSTADFPRAESIAPLGNKQYRVASYVDAQNGFGAQIRTYWICDIRQDPANDDLWLLDDLAM